MLWSAPDRELRQVASAADDTPSGRRAPRAKSEQSLERSHGCLAPVMAKDELVEISGAPRAFPAVPRAQRERTRVSAARTSESVRPPTGFQILPARRFVGELALELAQAGRERGTGHGATTTNSGHLSQADKQKPPKRELVNCSTQFSSVLRIGGVFSSLCSCS
jgi:hypothetical protein